MKTKQEIEIYSLAYGGMGVAKLDGKICFVEDALPGEKVRFVKESEKKRFIIGRATGILTASSDRVEPLCPYYGRCGGCQYQHLNYEKEIYHKTEQAKEILRRIGGFTEYHLEEIMPSPLHYGYRSSITLHKSDSGYGYFGKDNKTVIPIEKCSLAQEAINRAIGTIDALRGKRDITLKCDGEGNVRISGYPGHRFFNDDYLGTRLTFSPLAFSQTNRQIAVAMVEKLRLFVQKEKRQTLFDFYCGTGFFGILMRDLFESIIGIDESRVAIECAKTAKRSLAIGNIRFYMGDSDSSFPLRYEELRGKINTILLDPPRSGISKKLITWFSTLKDADSLYYISCDPAILARDAKLLTQDRGWKLDRVACFDMFPRTKHLESIAVFRRV